MGFYCMSNGADGKANWSSVVNFHCMQMSLVMSMWFIFVMIEMMCHMQ